MSNWELPFFYFFYFLQKWPPGIAKINTLALGNLKKKKKNPLAKLTSDSKKRKLSDEKVDATTFPPVHVTPPSPTLSLEVTVVTPSLTRTKGKSKVGMSVWDDPTTALGHAHNVITNDELKGLSSIPSHELIGRHIHKLVQVCNSVIPASLF